MLKIKIIEDYTLPYNNGQALFVMIIKSENRIYVEIDSKEEFVGRKTVRDINQAYAAFELIKNQLSQQSDFNESLSILELAFSLDKINELMFFMAVHSNEFDLNTLWHMRRRFGFKTNPTIVDRVFEEKKFNNSIEVWFPTYVLPLGKFRTQSEDSKFKFEINSVFLYRIKYSYYKN